MIVGKFLSKSFLSSVVVALGWSQSSCKTEAQPTQNQADKTQKETILPIVVATWPNQKANEAAWEKLQKGGSALDAVEAGARVPEADPKDRSVGYGGRPDRDGNVTLDACIMDEKGNCGAVCFLQHIKHPISVARKVMEDTPHVMLAGRRGFGICPLKGLSKRKSFDSKVQE